MISSRLSLVTTFKSFIRPHLYYGDIDFDQPFHDNLESIQYNALLAITGGTRRIWKKEGLYQDLDLVSL